MSVVTLITQSGVVAKGVLLTLLFFSVACWTVVFMKLLSYGRARNESERFLRSFRESKNLYATFEEAKRFSRSPTATVFQEGYRELSALVKGNPGPASSGPAVAQAVRTAEADGLMGVTRTLRQASLAEISRLERHLIFLATTGNVAPFIGLFGTVWGIMDAFASIGAAGSANLGAVAPGIAEALITTAAGLATAIPAVIAYNYFLNRVKGFATSLDLFTLEFTTLAEKVVARARAK